MINIALTKEPATGIQISHERIHLRTRDCLEFIDITEEVRAQVAGTGIRDGIVNIQTLHTTAMVMVNEHEPLLLEDLARALEALAPRGYRYRHDDFAVRTVNLTPNENPNGHAHCKALFLRSSESLNLVNGEIQLGPWQRIFFVELDCARDRTLSVIVMGC
jgi:secondary thiamine-phosphate synthase enzyme